MTTPSRSSQYSNTTTLTLVANNIDVDLARVAADAATTLTALMRCVF